MTALENARLDALDRQFRGADVQVIEKHSKLARLGITDQIDLRRMREHGFRNETSSVFRDLSSNHSRRDELAFVVEALVLIRSCDTEAALLGQRADAVA